MELRDKIWLTRKCRIEASERLNRFDFFSKLILVYYSAFILCISIFDFVNPNSNLSFSLIVSSLLVLIASLFIASRNFKERSISFKQGYIRLNQLLENYTSKQDVDDDQINNKLSDEYFNVLNLTENHSEFDYLIVKLKLSSEEPTLKISAREKFSLFFIIILRYLFVTVLFIIPILTLFYSI